MKIAAVGDVMFGDQPVCFGFGVMSEAKIKGYGYLFKHVKEVFSQYDLVIGNLESVLADPLPHENHNLWSMMNRGMDEAADSLRNAGVNLVSLANNHIFEHNENALDRTIKNLDKVGIVHIGSKTHPVFVYKKDNCRVGFLAWSLLPDRYWQDKEPREYYNITNDVPDIVNDVQKIKNDVDYLILSLHWGNEFIQQPSKQQQSQAHLLVDSGIDVILGHHPHVLQPVERYKHGLIFYSLGNFISDYWIASCKQSVIIELNINSGIDYKAIPVIISENYAPVLSKGSDMDEESLFRMENFMDDETYNATLYKKRQEYRLSVIRHFAKNFFRYDKKNLLKLLRWSLKRAFYVFKTRKREKERPNTVYEGPMKG